MRSEDFKGILLTVLIILSLLVPLIFLGNNSSKIVHASPDEEAGKPIEIKVKVFVLENGPDWTDNDIKNTMGEVNDILNNSNAGIKLVQGPLYRDFPGSVKTKEDRKAVREKVRENLQGEKFKGIALIMAKEGSIDDNPSCMGKAEKSNPASAIVAQDSGQVWLHEIGHVLCLDDVDNENNIMNKAVTDWSKGLSPEQIENMKKKADKLNDLISENNENRTPCTSAIDTIGDVKDKMTDNLAPDPGGIDIRVVNTPLLSPGTIDVEIISMSLMGRGDNLHLYYAFGFNTDDNLETGGYFIDLAGVDRIIHIWLDGIFPFQSPEGSSEVGVTNVENNDYIYVGPAEIHTFVEVAELLGQGAEIQSDNVDNVDNVRDGVRARISLDLLGPMADNVPAIAVAMDLDNGVEDTLTFICNTTVPPAPWMSISSRTGKPGDNIQIVGGGFPAESFFDVFVTLALGGTEVEVAHTAIDENGKFATTFEVPNLPPDNYFLTAIDNGFNLVFLMFTAHAIYAWPMFRCGPDHTGYTPVAGPIDNTLAWRYSTAGTVRSSPAVADGRVYVGSYDCKVYCLNASNGAFIWSYTTGGGVFSSPAVADGKVYVGSGDWYVYCLNAENGALIWRYPTGGDVYSSPAVADGKVYVGSWDRYVYCLNAENGALIWRYPTGGYVLSSPAVAAGRVYVGSYDNKVYCLNADNGALIWSYTTGSYVVYSSPAVADGRVYVGSEDRKVYCLNADNGALIWSYTTGDYVFSSPAVAGGKVYVGSDDRKVYCLNADNGALIWSYTTGSYVGSSPAVVVGKVYVGSHDGYVYCFGSHWEGTATFKLENLYKLNLYKDIWLYEGRKLVVKFYKYDNITLQANSVIEDITPPENVKENENVPHPRAAERFPWGTVQIARLVLTTENENEVISTIASFTVHQSHLRDRDKAILTQWGGHPELWDAFRNEDKDILTLWGSAPP